MNDTQKTEHLYKKKNIAESFDPDREKYAHQIYKHKVEAALIKKSLREIPSKEVSILDVACGTGRMVDEIFDSRKRVKYTGLDTSRSMTSFLKKKISNKKYSKDVQIVIGDASSLPFKDNTFDLTFSYHLLWHLEKKDQSKILREMKRVTRPGGIIVFDILNERFLWERIKKKFRIQAKELNKLSITEAKKYLGHVRSVRIEKLSDPRINNDSLYSIFNVVNHSRYILPSSMFHMVYLQVKK